MARSSSPIILFDLQGIRPRPIRGRGAIPLFDCRRPRSRRRRVFCPSDKIFELIDPQVPTQPFRLEPVDLPIGKRQLVRRRSVRMLVFRTSNLPCCSLKTTRADRLLLQHLLPETRRFRSGKGNGLAIDASFGWTLAFLNFVQIFCKEFVNIFQEIYLPKKGK